MAVTIKDIAELANVSHATVSRALAGSSLVNPATRERVQRLATELDYRPNGIARSLVRQTTKTLGLVVMEQSSFLAEMTQAIYHEAVQRDYDLLIAIHVPDSGRQTHALQRLLDRQVDGVLLNCAPSPEGHRLLGVGGQLVPCVSMHLADEAKAVSHIVTDCLAAMELAVRHLTGLGRTRIAYVGGDVVKAHWHGTRYEGFLAAMERRGLEPAACLSVSSGAPGMSQTCREAFEIGRALARRTPPPDAIVCVSDLVALRVMAGLREGGLRVPDDVGIVGFDGIAEGEFSDPPLTTIPQPLDRIVPMAMDILLAQMADPDLPARKVALEPQLLVRRSCGATGSE